MIITCDSNNLEESYRACKIVIEMSMVNICEIFDQMLI